MTDFVQNLNYLLALGTLLMNVAVVFLLVVYVKGDLVPGGKEVAELVKRWGVQIALILATISSATTLYYSEILGFAPCSLCWFQRIFLYPQVVLLALAAWKRDASVALYVIALSALGLVPSLYQHAMQMWDLGTLPCPAGSAEGVNCAQRILFEFGYITYPWMAVSVFVLLIVLMLFIRRKNS